MVFIREENMIGPYLLLPQRLEFKWNLGHGPYQLVSKLDPDALILVAWEGEDDHDMFLCFAGKCSCSCKWEK